MILNVSCYYNTITRRVYPKDDMRAAIEGKVKPYLNINVTFTNATPAQVREIGEMTCGTAEVCECSFADNNSALLENLVG